ncbi:hypothetical protein GFK82_00137 [Candidatus Steffania adelgidicola]|nr:hypothetical protein GFK82_00137 [Candidatus Steffania adelgidicola]
MNPSYISLAETLIYFYYVVSMIKIIYPIKNIDGRLILKLIIFTESKIYGISYNRGKELIF